MAKTKFLNMDLTPSYLTPAMEEVIAIRAKRLASGKIFTLLRSRNYPTLALSLAPLFKK